MTGVPVTWREREKRPEGRPPKPADPDDPFFLVGVRFPVPDEVEADREIARCFIEEFALLGWPPRRIRLIFSSPVYQGAHDIAQRRGPAFIDGLIAEVFRGEGGER